MALVAGLEEWARVWGGYSDGAETSRANPCVARVHDVDDTARRCLLELKERKPHPSFEATHVRVIEYVIHETGVLWPRYFVGLEAELDPRKKLEGSVLVALGRGHHDISDEGVDGDGSDHEVDDVDTLTGKLADHHLPPISSRRHHEPNISCRCS